MPFVKTSAAPSKTFTADNYPAAPSRIGLVACKKREFNQQYVGKASCEFFEAPFISVSNATQIKTDILTTVLISLSALCLLLIFFYRSVIVPVIAFIPSLFGVLTALAFLYVLKGSISAR